MEFFSSNHSSAFSSSQAVAELRGCFEELRAPLASEILMSMFPLHFCLLLSLVVRKRLRAFSFVAVLLLLCSAQAAQFVEVEATIDVTGWRFQEETGLPLKSSRNYSVRCVVGTNTWLVENRATNGVSTSTWFVDGKIVRLNSYGQETISDDSGFTGGRRGMRSANYAVSEDGYPSGDASLNLPWFAFCSGPYLKRPGRSVPLPAPAASRAAFGFRDETKAFLDSLGLPERVDLFTGKRQTKCEYRVQQSTNVLGWNIPTAFTVLQNEPDQFDQWHRQLTATGRVTVIRPATSPDLPADIQARLQMLERYPSRRK
jgi:hypothetical protein